MSIEAARRIVCVVAHPDDLEMMAGGSVARWVEEGRSVHVITLSNGSWTSPDGRVMREPQAAIEEERRAAACLGYTVENLGYPAMELRFEDRLVCEVLRRIDERGCDLLVCPWERDLHHDHEVASRVAVAAARRVPRVLMGQINHYLRDFFAPNVFVDIRRTWSRKIEALRCYASEWARSGAEWESFLDETTRYYGRLVGVERAEGFISHKLLL